MSNKNTVIFNALGMEFGIIFVAKSEETISPIRDLAIENGMNLDLVGNSSDDDIVWVLIKKDDHPNGIKFLSDIKDTCTVEKGWYTDHCRTNIPYMLFLNDESLPTGVTHTNVQA